MSSRRLLGTAESVDFKVGINPKSKYNTPNGIYSYPLTTKIYRDMSRGELPFAQNQPYFSIFKISEGAKIEIIFPGT